MRDSGPMLAERVFVERAACLTLSAAPSIIEACVLTSADVDTEGAAAVGAALASAGMGVWRRHETARIGFKARNGAREHDRVGLGEQ